jgi:hypothetical protein
MYRPNLLFFFQIKKKIQFKTRYVEENNHAIRTSKSLHMMLDFHHHTCECLTRLVLGTDYPEKIYDCFHVKPSFWDAWYFIDNVLYRFLFVSFFFNFQLTCQQNK